MKSRNARIDLHTMKDELVKFEEMNLLLDDEGADAVRSFLAFFFMKNTDMERDEIYSLVFRVGMRIRWN